MTDSVRALNARLAEAERAGPGDVLLDAVAALGEAATLYDEMGRTDYARALRHLADALTPKGGQDEARPSDAAWSPSILDDLKKYVVRAIFALKTPSPDGSSHYQSGWDDGLEAAMDAAGNSIAALFGDSKGGS